MNAQDNGIGVTFGPGGLTEANTFMSRQGSGRWMVSKDQADKFRLALGWDGTGEPPIVTIMGDGTLMRHEKVEHAFAWMARGDYIEGIPFGSEVRRGDPYVSDGPLNDEDEPLYRLVDPEAEQDARALEALGPELLAHIDNMEAE